MNRDDHRPDAATPDTAGTADAAGDTDRQRRAVLTRLAKVGAYAAPVSVALLSMRSTAIAAS